MHLHHDIAEEVFVTISWLEKPFFFSLHPHIQYKVLLLFGQLVPSLMQLDIIFAFHFSRIFIIQHAFNTYFLE